MKEIPYTLHSIRENDVRVVGAVLRSGHITQGPRVEEFERAVCRQCGCRYAVVVSSGTAALHLACLAAGITRGDEVIVPAVTFIASANCVIYCGGTPVLTDINLDDYTIDLASIKSNITRKTRAIISVDFAGRPAHLREIARIARKHRLLVIEDAAHSLGAEYRGSKIGSCRYADMTTLSFHAAKRTTTGEGGAITTNNKRLYQLLCSLRNHGICKDEKTKRVGPWHYEMRMLGYNYRMTDFQAALGLQQLKRLSANLKKRRRIAAAYYSQLSELDKKIALPLLDDSMHKSAWHLFVLRLPKRLMRKTKKQIFEALISRGIGVQLHYTPLFMHPYYRKQFRIQPKHYPNSLRYYDEAISIPFYETLSVSERNRVMRECISVIKRCTGKKVGC